MPLNVPLRRPRSRGFTLIEVLIAVMIVGILATVATASYRDYVTRAQLAQQLVNVDQIRTVLTVAARDGQHDLQQGARSGQVPPALAGQLDEQAFRGLDGLRLQLVRWPLDPGYALVANVDGTDGERRLGLFQREVDRAGFQNAWLTQRAFVFRIADDPSSPVPGTPPDLPAGQPSVGGSTGGQPSSGVTPGGTTPPVTLPVTAPPVTAPPITTPSGATPLSPPAGSTAPPVAGGKPPATSTDSGATNSGTAPAPGACPPGTVRIGNSGQCRSTTGQCPPGMHPVGNSGHCKP